MHLLNQEEGKGRERQQGQGIVCLVCVEMYICVPGLSYSWCTNEQIKYNGL